MWGDRPEVRGIRSDPPNLYIGSACCSDLETGNQADFSVAKELCSETALARDLSLGSSWPQRLAVGLRRWERLAAGALGRRAGPWEGACRAGIAGWKDTLCSIPRRLGTCPLEARGWVALLVGRGSPWQTGAPGKGLQGRFTAGNESMGSTE